SHQSEGGGGSEGVDVELAVEPDRDPDVPDAGGQGEERDDTQGAEGNRPDETDPLRARGGRPTFLAGRGERRWRIGPRQSGRCALRIDLQLRHKRRTRHTRVPRNAPRAEAGSARDQPITGASGVPPHGGPTPMPRRRPPARGPAPPTPRHPTERSRHEPGTARPRRGSPPRTPEP